MNQQQRKYAKDRLEQLYREKLSLISDKHTQKAVVLTSQERFKAFKAGKYTIKKDFDGKIHAYTDLMKIIDFSGEKESVINHAKIEADKSLLGNDYRKAMDELMLGDCETALKLN